MSFGIGDANKRPGIFESFRTAMTPRELPPDDGKPLTPPRTVLAATAMAILGGLVFLFIGGGSLFSIDSQLNAAVAAYDQTAKDCVAQFQGIGSAVVIPEGAADDVVAKGQNCQTFPALTPTDEMKSSAKTQSIVFAAIFVVIGLVAVAGGWFLRLGARWARLAVAGAVVLAMALALLFQAQNLLTLVATLFMIVAVMLCFIGKGQIYFARVKARRAG
ncbi:MAG: hypothetical protein ABWZ98_08615 [Nakamurella sp.]